MPPRLQASLAAMLLLRDMLVQLVPQEPQATLLGQGAAAGGAHSTPSAAAARDGTPVSAPHPQRQRQSSAELPGTLFKAAAVIRDELVLCALRLPCLLCLPSARQGRAATASPLTDAPGYPSQAIT